MVDGKLHKYKTRWCIRGDQQDYENEDSYAPVLKTATEALLLVAIAAQHAMMEQISTAQTQKRRSSMAIWLKMKTFM
jgi:hypothetical protein